MSDFIATRLCLLCSYRTIELKQYGKTRKDGVKNTRTYQATNKGLKCTSCSGFVCVDCIKLLLPKIETDAKHHVNDSILKAFRFCARTNATPPNYIGHCCAIGGRPKPDVDGDHSTSNNPNNMGFDSKEAEVPPVKPRLSGCIHFPEFGIFIDSPYDCMDIHAVGAESRFPKKNKKLKRDKSGNLKPPAKEEYLSSRWHRVIPHDFALMNNDQAPPLKAPMPKSWKHRMMSVKIKQPHCSAIKKYNIRIIIIQKLRPISAKSKASNVPTVAELEEGYLFSGLGPFTKQAKPDITFVLGTDPDRDGSYASILLCRFHKFQPNLHSRQRRELFKNSWKLLRANKFECRRTGGSSGFVTDTVDNVIKKFMSCPGSSPRSGKGAVWIRGSDTWFVYYIGTYDGIPKTCKYTNPVPGGSFFFPTNSLSQFSFLNQFISTKPITALVVEKLQEKLKNKAGFDVAITPHAVSEELRNIAETKSIVSAYKSKSDDLPLDLEPFTDPFQGNDFELFYAIYNRDFIKYTIVMHPVGLHKDTFADGTPSLENKVCFKLNQADIPQEMLRTTHPNGRGGGSSSEFVFAILDWSSGQRDKRRVWTHPSNSHLPHAPANPTQQLNRNIWRDFFTAGNVFVPQGVNARNL